MSESLSDWPAIDPSDEMSVPQRIAAVAGRLRASERAVANFVAVNPVLSASYSAYRLAGEVGVSDASVMRAARALGYEGFSGLKRALQRDLSLAYNSRYRIDRRSSMLRTDADSYIESVRSTAHQLVDEVYSRVDPAELRVVAERLGAAQTVHAYGVGPSGVMAEYLALRLGRIGLRTRWSRATGFAFADDLVQIRDGDVVVLIAPGRMHRDMDVLLERAAECSITVIAVTDTLGPILESRVNHVLWAPFAASGVLGETFTTLQVTELLTDAVSSLDAPAAEAAYSRLSAARDKLVHPDRHMER